MGYSLTNYLWFFIIYSFLGWVAEVAFQTVTEGKFINRGFLNGPICPIYGFGMCLLIYLLGPISDKLILLFIASIFLTSALEFITGFILEKIFNNKWWDYSDKPFNIKGYICLSFSLIWGLGALFMINIIHPYIGKLVSFLDKKKLGLLLIIVLICFFIDFIITVLGIFKINRHFRLLEEVARKLHSYSDELGEEIYSKVSMTIKMSDKINHKIQDSKLEFENKVENYEKIVKLKERYKKLLEEKAFVHKRLEKAFPNIKDKLNKYR